MNEEELKNMIKSHEGFKPYVYYDSLGFPTGGYGHAFLEKSPISHDVAELLFEEDFNVSVKSYNKLKLDLDPVRRAVVIDMLFNLGLPRFRKFKKLLKALRKKNWTEASKEMRDSLWFEQVGWRAKKLCEMIENG